MTHGEPVSDNQAGANRAKRWRTGGMVALLVIYSFIVAGCCTHHHSGTIYLDHGEVFTRERLVNERLNNLNWLQNQLNNTPAGGTLQGGRYQSQSTSVSGQVSAQFNPLGQISPLGQQAIQPSARTIQLESQLQEQALQQEVNGLKSNTISYTNFVGSGGILGTQLGNSFGAVAPSNAVPVINIMNAISGPTNSAPGPSNNVSLPGGSSIQVTSVEAFQDQLAYRDAVLGEMHEQELDDTHDRNGMTLYSIDFHLSVAPGENNNCFGRVSADFGEDPMETNNPEEYWKWLAAFRKTFDHEVMSVQRRYLQNYLTDDEIRQLIIDGWKYQEAADGWLRTNKTLDELTWQYTNSLASLDSVKPDNLLEAIQQSYALDIQQRGISDMLGTSVGAAKLVTLITNELASSESLSTNIPDVIQQMQTNRWESPGAASAATAADKLLKDWQKTNILNELKVAITSQFQSSTNMLGRYENARYCLGTLPQYLLSKRNEASSDPVTDSNAMKALCWVVKDEFEQVNSAVYGHLIEIEPPENVSTDPGDYMYLMRVRDVTNGPINFEKAMNYLSTNTEAHPFVYAIEPKEYAQNLMDESDEQSSLSLALGLSAAIPQISTSLSLYLQYIKENETMLETIKRRPLLTAYMDGTNRFGWLIGGRFKIGDDLALTYEQIPVQEAVQVTLEVPSWWSAVKFNVTSQWLHASGRPYHAGESGSRVLQLRPDFDGLTLALLEDADPDYLQPQIYPIWDRDPNQRGYVVQAGAPATFLILGRNLWRNPVVFVGSQSTADTYNYNVLPDMQGIVATFPNISMPETLSTNSAQSVSVDLRVVTSDGEAVLKDGVTVISGGMQGSGGGFVVMTNFFGVPGSNITFNVSAAPPSSVFASYQLALSPSNGKPIPVATNMISNGALTFQIPTNAGLWPAATQARIDLWMQPTPNSEPASVLLGGEQNFVIYTNLAQSWFTFVNTNVTFSAANPATSGSISVSPSLTPNLFWLARPALIGQLENSPPGQIQLQLSTGAASVNLNSGAFNGSNIVFSLNNIGVQAITNALGWTGNYTTNFNGVIVVPANNPQFTIPISGNIFLNHQN
jgi:hypothetical protein